MQREDLAYLTDGVRAPGRDDRLSALEVLLRHASKGNELAQQALRDLVRDYRQCDRESYCRALNRIEWFGDTSLENTLLAALADADYGCQAWTAAACGTLGLHAASPLLVGLLQHPDGQVREAACDALGRLQASDAVAPLAQRLRDDQEHVRAAATALARIGDDRAEDALWSDLRSLPFDRLGYLASALASLGPRVVDRLLAMAAEPDPQLRYWAARALGTTGEERGRPALQHLAEHDHERTRFGGHVSTAARKALRTLDRLHHSPA